MAINTNEIPTAFEESFDMSKFDPRNIEWTHSTARTKLYPAVQDQLDMLFKDIDAGLFGEQAKTGQFYQAIKDVKETHPKGETYKPYADLPGPDETHD
jgi:hypothetical protein